MSFAFCGANGRVEFLLDSLPPGATAGSIPGWLDVSAANPPAQIGWVTADNGKSFSNPQALDLAQQQTATAFLLRAACTSAISGSFVSSALGADNVYPADDASQRNMLAAAISGGALWCASGSMWNFAAHSSAQAQQVVGDWSSARAAHQNTLASLTTVVANATTPAATAAISWPSST